jgi:hypothetical protein
VVLVAACAAKHPPRGPEYKPEQTPEPTTACPKEAAAARKAREALIGEDDPLLRAQTAEKVFAHAECERLQFDAMRLDAEDEAMFKEGVRKLKAQLASTDNLYGEVTNYTVPSWSVGAHARSGDLYHAYADKLRRTEPGMAIADPSTRALWFAEMEELGRQVDAEAAKRWDQALDLVDLGPPEFTQQAHVATWARAACIGLKSVDPPAASAHPFCN